MESQITGLQAFCMPSVSISQKDRLSQWHFWHKVLSLSWPTITCWHRALCGPCWTKFLWTKTESLAKSLWGFLSWTTLNWTEGQKRECAPSGHSGETWNQIFRSDHCNLTVPSCFSSFPFSSTFFFFFPKTPNGLFKNLFKDIILCGYILCSCHQALSQSLFPNLMLTSFYWAAYIMGKLGDEWEFLLTYIIK